jgi:hypothetical protein
MSHGKVLLKDTGESGDPASYTLAIAHQNGALFCSAALIHPLIVLTASHCEVKPGDFVVKMDHQGKSDIRLVKKVILNETYLKSKSSSGLTALNISSDLSLLLLDSGYENVRDILPRNEPRLENNLIVSGFGRNESNSIDYKLRASVIYAIGIIKATNIDPYARIAVEKQGNTIICDGDSGGPAILRDGTLVGITVSSGGADSANYNCGDDTHSSHASVWHAMPWITSNMNALLASSQNSFGSDPSVILPNSQLPANSVATYVDNPPPYACSKITGIFDVLPTVVRRTDNSEPGFVCRDSNPQTPDPVIRCRSSTDFNSCQNTGFCYLNGVPTSCTASVSP